MPPAPRETASETIDSVLFARMLTVSFALTSAKAPIQACVSLSITPMSTPAPMPAVPPAESAPATLRIVVSSIAESAMSWVIVGEPGSITLTLARSPANAHVVSSITLTTAEPATPAVPPPAPPAATVVKSPVVVAAIEIPVEPRAVSVVPMPM